MTKTYVGDIGTAIVLDTGQALAGASAVSIEVLLPGGTAQASWPGTVVESTKVQFFSLADTFASAGEHKLQARVVLPGGTWLGETVGLTVYRPFG